MRHSSHTEFSLERGLKLLLDDPKGAERVMHEMAEGDAGKLPELFTPYGLYPFPQETCISIIQTLEATIPAGHHDVTNCYRYFQRPPWPPNTIRQLLSDADQQALKASKILNTSMSVWDLLVALGMIKFEKEVVMDFARVSVERERTICKNMHGDPQA